MKALAVGARRDAQAARESAAPRFLRAEAARRRDRVDAEIGSLEQLARALEAHRFVALIAGAVLSTLLRK